MADKKEEANAANAPAKGGKKKLLIMVIAALVLSGAGGGAWWYTRHNAEDGGETAKAAPVLPPVFVALDPFTVNLQPEAVGSQYMQIGITLKIAGPVMAEKLKEQMPEVRSRLLMVLSAKKASELLAPEGKVRLVGELKMEITRILDPDAARKLAKPQAPSVTVAAAAAETRTDAVEPRSEEAATEAGAAETAAETPVAAAAPPAARPAAETPGAGPVLGVLFTSFIIQ